MILDADRTQNFLTSGKRDERLLRRMVLPRAFGSAAYDLFLENLVRGSIHLSNGMEAISAAFGEALEPSDWVVHTYRGHAHLINRGTDVFAMLAELLGRSTGLHGGKSGSMHMSDRSRGSLGSYAIIGAHIPIAVGAAWASLIRDDARVTVCFFGDGATNIGAFHEALNLAAVWKLPIVFVCENNQYQEYTSIGDVTAVKQPAADRALAYGLDRVLVDGNDVELMYAAATQAIAACRTGSGPVMIEANTYRHGGHSRHDDGKAYRPESEVRAWRDRDPIKLYRNALMERGWTDNMFDVVDLEAQDLVGDAVAAARLSSESLASTAFENVFAFAEGGKSW